MKKMFNTPIGWYGGKYFMLDILIPLIPQHNTYVEVFGGGAQLLFAKEPSKVEVYNDLNSGLVNFFKVLRDKEKCLLLQDLLEKTPYAREEFYFCRDNWEKTDDEIEKARRFFVKTRQSMSGIGQSWSFGVVMNSTHSHKNIIRDLKFASERFRDIYVENRDFKFVLEHYDSVNTFFYLDPPYVMDTRSKGDVYDFEFSLDKHAELVDCLLKIKGKALLSGYEHDVYNPLIDKGWTKYSFDVKLHAAVKSRKNNEENAPRPMRTEVLWMNYKPEYTMF
jgi:DNA adenine methylase